MLQLDVHSNLEAALLVLRLANAGLDRQFGGLRQSLSFGEH